MSWNIWLGKHYSQVLDFFRKQNSDIIGLQELDADTARDQAGQIARELGYQYVFYPSFEGTVTTGKGDAVLSRYPILNSARHFLRPSVDYDGTPTTEPRIAVVARVSIDDSTLTVYSTHLAYAAHFAPSPAQAAQAEALASLVRGREKSMSGPSSSGRRTGCPSTGSIWKRCERPERTARRGRFVRILQLHSRCDPIMNKTVPSVRS